MDTDTAFLRQVAAVLKTMMESKRSQRLATFSAATDHALFFESKTKQVHHALWVFAAVQTYAAVDACVAKCFFALFRENPSIILILNESAFFRSVLTQKKTAAMTSLAKSIRTVTKAFLLFHGIGHMVNCLQDHRLHATVLENRKSDRGCFSARDKSLECSVELR